MPSDIKPPRLFPEREDRWSGTTVIVEGWYDLPNLIAGGLVRLPMFTIYKHPKDFPDNYVVRLFDMDKPTSYVMLAQSEEHAISLIPPEFVRLERNQEDDASIVATYI